MKLLKRLSCTPKKIPTENVATASRAKLLFHCEKGVRRPGTGEEGRRAHALRQIVGGELEWTISLVLS